MSDSQSKVNIKPNDLDNNGDSSKAVSSAFIGENVQNLRDDTNSFGNKSEVTEDLLSENLSGENTLSGENADLESDDDMLNASHIVGLRLDEDEENPKELNIAADVEAAERYHREN